MLFKHKHKYHLLDTRFGKSKKEKYMGGTLKSMPMFWFYLCKCGHFKIHLGGIERITVEGKLQIDTRNVYDKDVVDKYLMKYIPQVCIDNNYNNKA